MTTLGHVMHFWCRLFPMSTDGQAWRWRTKRSWCKLQSISPPNDSLQGLQPAVTRAGRGVGGKSQSSELMHLSTLCTPAGSLSVLTSHEHYPHIIPPHIQPVTISLRSDICHHVPPLCCLGIKQSLISAIHSEDIGTSVLKLLTCIPYTHVP